MTTEDQERRRTSRLAAYERLQAERPHLFANPPNSAYRILFERHEQDLMADQAAGWARDHDIPEEYADIGVIYEDPYHILIRDAVLFRSGRRGVYGRIVGAAKGVGAAVLPVLDDGRIALVHHFRHADRTWFWEIPRGFGESGISGIDSARRELEEELACQVRELVYLGSLSTDSGASAGVDEIYLGRIYSNTLTTTPSNGAIEEGIDDIKLVDVKTFRSMIAKGDIIDSYTLASYSLASVQNFL